MQIHRSALLPEFCRPFNRQCMHCQTVRGECFDSSQCILHICPCLTRKSCDQIHIDIIKSKLSCHAKNAFYIFNGMLSSDQIQCLLLHRLWIDRNSRHRISADHFQLFSRNAVRSACLHCKLFQFRQIKTVPDCSEKAI